MIQLKCCAIFLKDILIIDRTVTARLAALLLNLNRRLSGNHGHRPLLGIVGIDLENLQ